MSRRFLLLIFSLFLVDAYAQNTKCQNIYVWGFIDQDNQKNKITKDFTSAIEEALSINKCILLQRSKFASLQAQFENEKSILSVRDMKSVLKDSLSIIQAERVVFGEVDWSQSNVRLKIRIEDLNTTRVECIKSVEFAITDTYNKLKVDSIAKNLVTDLINSNNKEIEYSEESKKMPPKVELKIELKGRTILLHIDFLNDVPIYIQSNLRVFQNEKQDFQNAGVNDIHRPTKNPNNKGRLDTPFYPSKKRNQQVEIADFIREFLPSDFNMYLRCEIAFWSIYQEQFENKALESQKVIFNFIVDTKNNTLIPLPLNALPDTYDAFKLFKMKTPSKD